MKRKTPSPKALEAIQRKFEDMGLGTEAQRQHFRDLGSWPNYGHLPKPKGGGVRRVKRRVADKRDLALAAMRNKVEEFRRA